MKATKRLFLIILSVYTLFTYIPKVFADEKVIRVLAIGTENSQKKFAKNLDAKIFEEKPEIAFGEKIAENKGYPVYISYLNTDIQIQILKDYTENKKEVKGFIKEKLLKTKPACRIHSDSLITDEQTWYDFEVILATVVVDQGIEKVKEDIKNIVEFICDAKDDYTQVIVVGCSDTEDVPVLILSNYVTGIEQMSTPSKWGTKHDKNFEEQFLGFFAFPLNRERSKFYNSLIESANTHASLKKQRPIWKKILGTSTNLLKRAIEKFFPLPPVT